MSCRLREWLICSDVNKSLWAELAGHLMWVNTAHQLGETVHLAMSSMTSMLVNHETTHAHVARDASDLQKVHQWFDTHDAFICGKWWKTAEYLQQFNCRGDDNITCDMAEEVGCEIHKPMDDKMFADVTLPKANQIHYTTRKEQPADVTALFHRLIILVTFSHTSVILGGWVSEWVVS